MRVNDSCTCFAGSHGNGDISYVWHQRHYPNKNMQRNRFHQLVFWRQWVVPWKTWRTFIRTIGTIIFSIFNFGPLNEERFAATTIEMCTWRAVAFDTTIGSGWFAVLYFGPWPAVCSQRFYYISSLLECSFDVFDLKIY